jgi:hypothetical protein
VKLRGLGLLIILLPSLATAQGRRPQPHIPRIVPVRMQMLQQPSGELRGTVRVDTLQTYPTKIITVPAAAGTLVIELNWKGGVPVLMSITSPAGHNLSGRIALGTRDGISPLRFEYRLSSQDAAKGPLEVELTPSMLSRMQGVKAIKLEDANLVVTITPDTEVATAKPAAGEPTNWPAVQKAVTEGRLLSKPEADVLEATVASDPNDLLARISLLAFYSSRGRQLSNARDLVQQRRRQVLWMIEHQGSSERIFALPELAPAPVGDILFDEVGTAQAKQLWMKQIDANPNDIPLLKNATRFLMNADFEGAKALVLEGRRIRPGDDQWIGILAELYSSAIQGRNGAPDQKTAEIAESELRSSNDPNLLATVAVELATPKQAILSNPTLKLKMPAKIELAEELANRAISIEPDQPIWAAALVNVLQIERATTLDPKQRISATKKMYEKLKGILELNPNRIYPAGNYSTLGTLAYELDDMANATKYSEQSLALAASSEWENDPSRAEAQHDSNSTLGRVALRNKDIEGAKKLLAKAGAASSAGSFDWRGPDMSLAQALLQVGQEQAVVDYLAACEKLWPSGVPLLQKWRDEIRKGKKPQLNRVDLQ